MLFRLRQAHIDALGRASFEERLLTFLREQFPEAARMPDEDLRRGVGAQVDRAAAHGFTTERQLAQYVMIAFLMGETFDRDDDEATRRERDQQRGAGVAPQELPCGEGADAGHVRVCEQA